MGRRNGSYSPDFNEGDWVRIVDAESLGIFRLAWSYHHPLQDEQMRFAGDTGQVKRVSFYHGGDELYELMGIPGVWHEACLEPSTPAAWRERLRRWRQLKDK